MDSGDDSRGKKIERILINSRIAIESWVKTQSAEIAIKKKVHMEVVVSVSKPVFPSRNGHDLLPEYKPKNEKENAC